MKEQVIEALTTLLKKIKLSTPLVESYTRSLSLEDVIPCNLSKFMKENNIPDDSWFFSDDEDEYICWTAEKEATPEYMEKDTRRRFRNKAFPNIYKLYISNGYKRVGFNSGLLRQFPTTNLYDLFTNCDYENLMKFINLHFKKD